MLALELVILGVLSQPSRVIAHQWPICWPIEPMGVQSIAVHCRLTPCSAPDHSWARGSKLNMLDANQFSAVVWRLQG